MSLPVRGAWIEMQTSFGGTTATGSLPVRGAWIEIDTPEKTALNAASSLPVRGAWIEMLLALADDLVLLVAPRAGSVD